ncbi:MAG: DUF2306 domain-containing protein [Chitinophagales bacterium]|nr:DUF2306 domain-containing protein [Chitinophagales bacterium]
MYLHLVTIIPCVFLGAYLLMVKKGTQIHKFLGRIYMVLMLITAIITLFMQAQVGPRIFNHFGFLHLFSVLTIYSVPTAYIAIKKGQVNKHKWKMILLYFGAIVIAGAFTFVPGRYLYEVFFG